MVGTRQVLSILLNELNIGLSWVYYGMGKFIGPAVFPVIFALTWSDCSAAGAIAGTLVGACFSMLSWILCARRLGAVTVETLGDDYSMLIGNVVALFVSPIIAIGVSMLAPQRFEWHLLRERTEAMLIEDDMTDKERATHRVLLALVDDDFDPVLALAPTPPSLPRDLQSEAALARNLVLTYWIGTGLSFVLIVAWPLLAMPIDIFPRSYFAWWVDITFIWGHAAAIVAILYPIWQVRHLLALALGFQPPSIFRVDAEDADDVDSEGTATVVASGCSPMTGQEASSNEESVSFSGCGGGGSHSGAASSSVTVAGGPRGHSNSDKEPEKALGLECSDSAPLGPEVGKQRGFEPSHEPYLPQQVESPGNYLEQAADTGLPEQAPDAGKFQSEGEEVQLQTIDTAQLAGSDCPRSELVPPRLLPLPPARGGKARPRKMVL